MCEELHKLRVFMVGVAPCKCLLVFLSLFWRFVAFRLRPFQVGCGAIGCEMLKNFSLLGVGLSSSSGEVGTEFVTELNRLATVPL